MPKQPIADQTEKNKKIQKIQKLQNTEDENTGLLKNPKKVYFGKIVTPIPNNHIPDHISYVFIAASIFQTVVAAVTSLYTYEHIKDKIFSSTDSVDNIIDNKVTAIAVTALQGFVILESIYNCILGISSKKTSKKLGCPKDNSLSYDIACYFILSGMLESLFAALTLIYSAVHSHSDVNISHGWLQSTSHKRHTSTDITVVQCCVFSIGFAKAMYGYIKPDKAKISQITEV